MSRTRQALEISNQWLAKQEKDYRMYPTPLNRKLLEWEKEHNKKLRRRVEKYCK